MPSNRVGISLLSRDNHSIAYNQELMCNKRTGEVSIKTASGDVISYQYFSRLKTHVDKMIDIASSYATGSQICSIEPDDITLPDAVVPSDSTNILTTPAVIDSAVSSFFLSVDIDPIVATTGEICKSLYKNISVSYTGVLKNSSNAVVQTISGTYNIDSLATQHNIFTETGASFELTDVKIVFSEVPENTIRCILHSILILINIS